MTKKAVSKQKILAAALIATVAAGGYFYYRQQQAAALPAFVAQSNGRLELNRIDVATLYPGRVKKVYVEEGADVKSGDILAELSSDTSSSRVEEARGSVKACSGPKRRKSKHAVPSPAPKPTSKPHGSSSAWRKWNGTMPATYCRSNWYRNPKPPAAGPITNARLPP